MSHERERPRAGGTNSCPSTEQLFEPVHESRGECSTHVQIARTDRRAHSPRLSSRREPGMDRGSRRLSFGEPPVLHRNAVDVAPGQRPDGIAARDHSCDEVLELAAGFVVGPQPDTHPRLAADNRAAWRRTSNLDVWTHTPQPIRDRRPTSRQIIVGIHDDAQPGCRRPSASREWFPSRSLARRSGKRPRSGAGPDRPAGQSRCRRLPACPAHERGTSHRTWAPVTVFTCPDGDLFTAHQQLEQDSGTGAGSVNAHGVEHRRLDHRVPAREERHAAQARDGQILDSPEPLYREARKMDAAVRSCVGSGFGVPG